MELSVRCAPRRKESRFRLRFMSCCDLRYTARMVPPKPPARHSGGTMTANGRFDAVRLLVLVVSTEACARGLPRAREAQAQMEQGAAARATKSPLGSLIERALPRAAPGLPVTLTALAANAVSATGVLNPRGGFDDPRLRVPAPIHVVAISADGVWLAAGTATGVSVFSRASGARAFVKNIPRLRELLFVDSTLWALDSDGGIWWWLVGDAGEPRRVQSESGLPGLQERALRVSADGTRVIAGRHVFARDGTEVVFASGIEAGTIEEEPDPWGVQAAGPRLAPGRHVVWIGDDGRTAITAIFGAVEDAAAPGGPSDALTAGATGWTIVDLATGERLVALDLPVAIEWPRALALPVSGPVLLALEGQVVVVDRQSGSLTGVIAIGARLDELGVEADGSEAVLRHGERVERWRLTGRAPVAFAEGPVEPLHAVNGAWTVEARAQVLRAWGPGEQRPVVPERPLVPFRAVSITDDGTTYAVIDAGAQVWLVTAAALARMVGRHDGSALLRFAAADAVLLSSAAGSVKIWDAATSEPKRELEGELTPLVGLAAARCLLDCAERRLCDGCRPEPLRCAQSVPELGIVSYDMSTGEPVREILVDPHLRDSDWLARGAGTTVAILRDDDLVVWDAAFAQALHVATAASDMRLLALSPRYILLGNDQGSLVLVSLAGEFLGTAEVNAPVVAAAFSANGRHLVLATEGGAALHFGVEPPPVANAPAAEAPTP